MSRRRGLSEPHERTFSCREERGRWRLGKGVPGRSIQAWDDIAERTQVRIYLTHTHLSSAKMWPCLLLPQVSWRNPCISLQRRDAGGHWSSSCVYEGVPERAPMTRVDSCHPVVLRYHSWFTTIWDSCWSWKADTSALFLTSFNHCWCQ